MATTADMLKQILAVEQDTNKKVTQLLNTPVTPVPTPTPTPVPTPLSPLKGFNIGNDQNATPAGTPYKSVQNAADLTALKGKVSRLRIALTYGLDLNDLANLKQLALDAKAQGFFVQFGITAGAQPDINAYYTKWLTTDVVAVAKWAQDNKIDEFTIGNEEDHNCQYNGAFTAKTPKQIRDDVRSKVADVKKVYFGPVVYCTSELVLNDWITEGIGQLDRIYFNVYDNLINFRLILNKIVSAFGTNHGGLSEWSAEHPYRAMRMTPQQYSAEIGARQEAVVASGLPSYAFTYRMNSDGSGWEFVLGDNSHRPGLDVILGS